MQWLIANLIDLLLHFLEVSLRQSPPPKSSAVDDDDDDDDHDFFAAHSDASHPHDNDDNANADATSRKNVHKKHQKLLQQAYEFMELQPPVTPEQLK